MTFSQSTAFPARQSAGRVPVTVLRVSVLPSVQSGWLRSTPVAEKNSTISRLIMEVYTCSQRATP